ncbi:AP2 [Babesia gibsoni]|uniref:AP2 n=1 Tax=Babesia gibsoni TaxID=33632 RepID=A0AAD8PE98_BABGI|nr:AP2 [Babesia gibsoni]
MSSYSLHYSDPFVKYQSADLYDGYRKPEFTPAQGMRFYEEYCGNNNDEYVGEMNYDGFVEGNNFSGVQAPVYLDYTMNPMVGINATMNYGAMDMGFYTPERMYYVKPGKDLNYVMSSGKSTAYDDSSKIADVSTAATTPSLDAAAYPEMVNDGFDLGYAYDFNKTAFVPMENVAGTNIPFNETYYAGFPSTYKLEDVYTPFNEHKALTNDASIIEIANEIATNVQFLPEKEANGKYSLDSDHPIHCVWRDLNRGHCSWRCRWWENGKRLSKNFNVKRFGEREAMWMAIAMKIRNSTPVERYQLLKEQREAVRNHLELLKQQANGSTLNAEYVEGMPMCTSSMPQSQRKKRHSLSSAKRAQRLNWMRISWTYVKVPEIRSGETSVVCRLCAKTTKCSRRRNLHQAHIMHLLRMHKNPWKKYLNVDGLTKMCRSALEALYEQQGFTDDSEWKLRPGLIPPEPTIDIESLDDTDSEEE